MFLFIFLLNPSLNCSRCRFYQDIHICIFTELYQRTSSPGQLLSHVYEAISIYQAICTSLTKKLFSFVHSSFSVNLHTQQNIFISSSRYLHVPNCQGISYYRHAKYPLLSYLSSYPTSLLIKPSPPPSTTNKTPLPSSSAVPNIPN